MAPLYEATVEDEMDLALLDALESPRWSAVEIVVYNRAILLFTTDSTEAERSLLPPHHGEAHRVIPVLLPLRLQSDPAVVNKTFAHLDER